MPGKSKIVLATHNDHKLGEFQAMLPEVWLLSAAELGLAEPEETGSTFQDNALIKAWAAARATLKPALADDSGLSVDGLDGAPGIYSARWANSDGRNGGDFTFAMGRIVRELEDRYGKFDAAPHTAHFTASLCLCWPDGEHLHFDGIAPGTLVQYPTGEAGFGYDPLFIPEGHAITYGEMPANEKNVISHRARAIALFKAWLGGNSELRRRLDQKA